MEKGIQRVNKLKANLVNSTGITINPVQDETVVLLRRLVKQLECVATIDWQNRQKVSLDYMTPGVLANAGVGVGAIGNTVGIAAPGVANTAYPLHTWECPVDQRWRVMEDSRISYQLGIRSHLSFT